MTIFIGIDVEKFTSQFNIGHILQLENFPFRVSLDDNVFVLLGLIESTFVSKYILKRLCTLARCLSQSSWPTDYTLLLHSFHYFVGRDIVSAHAVWFQPYTHGKLPASQYLRATHSTNALKLGKDMHAGIVV